VTQGGQQQKAGANAQQYQIAGDLVINQGVSEERAHEISRQTFHDMIAEFSVESHETAGVRVEKLDVRYIKQLADAGLLEALADPAYQVTLRKAQLGAASTERESDYDLLAGLLADRANRAENRPVRAGINRAVEVVDQLDDEALIGITVLMLALQIEPVSGFVEPGMQAIERCLQQVMEGQELPAGVDWLEHLDILDAVRIDRVQGFKKFEEFWASKTPGYIATGVMTDSEQDVQALVELGSLGLPPLVADHELKPGFRRIAFPKLSTMSKILRENYGATENQIQVAEKIARDVYGIENPEDALRPAYVERVRQYPYLSRLADWWDTLPHHFTLTAVGKVLARANAKRLDSMGILPDLS
jgi:hypothetical protein